MSYMNQVPYYATVPVLDSHCFDLPQVPVAPQRLLANALPGFGQRFDIAFLDQPRFPVEIAPWSWPAEGLPEDVYVLRLPIKRPGGRFAIPQALQALEGLLALCEATHRANDPFHADKFCYLTVRCGNRITSDTTWHVDGFQAGIRQDLKSAEVNYIWADKDPTEFFEGDLDWEGVDPTKHNVHVHMDAQINAQPSPGRTMRVEPNTVYAMNPYMPHRKPASEGFRRFVRITFCQTEIQDDTCSINPGLPMPRYNNTDVRWNLEEKLPTVLRSRRFGI